MSEKPSSDEKIDALFNRHPALPFLIFFGALSTVIVLAVLGIGKYRTWRNEHRPGSEIAADAARKSGYEVLASHCLIVPDGFGTYGCNDERYRAALIVADRQDRRFNLVAYCNSKKPEGCSFEIMDWKTRPGAYLVE